jgi:phosphate transport system ATP-binding protein
MAAERGSMMEIRSAASEPVTLCTEDLRACARDLPILKGITIEARRGEILAIIGPSGAGKTTFLRCLNRMAELDDVIRLSGKVLLEGESIYGDEVDVALLRRRIGMVFSVPIPLPMTIYGNLTFGLNLAGVARQNYDAIVETSLRAAYLWDEVKERLHEPARNLSGGQQQRLCLARSLTLQPRLLLLDEPCSGLDPISTRRIEEALQRLKENLTIILVTNNVKQAARASDRTAFFLFGELFEQSRTDELFTTPRRQETADYISGRFG